MKYSIKDIQEIAVKRCGKCLSLDYTTPKRLLFICKFGHEWTTSSSNIIRGTWCAICAGQVKHTIEELKELAKKRGGKCLSTEYINKDSRIEWECKEGHKWLCPMNSIRDGSWCPECKGVKRSTIERMQELAKSRGGECLSKEYKNAFTSLIWRCEEGHIWNATPAHIKNSNSWCPDCVTLRSERLCKKYLEEITGKRFIKHNPSWLQGLQLDGYCEELKLAFEYQGIQHYKKHEYFHRTEKDFIDQQNRDKLKRELCAQNNIILIEIPYKYSFKNEKDMYNFIDIQMNNLKPKGLNTSVFIK